MSYFSNIYQLNDVELKSLPIYIMYSARHRSTEVARHSCGDTNISLTGGDPNAWQSRLHFQRQPAASEKQSEALWRHNSGDQFSERTGRCHGLSALTEMFHDGDPTTFELAVYFKTVRAHNIDDPAPLVPPANELIE